MLSVCLFILLFFLLPCGSVPFYLPVLLSTAQDRDVLIVRYFELGFAYTEILAFLVVYHDIQISLRQLKRILSSHRCYRRINHSDIADVVDTIEEELRGALVMMATDKCTKDYGVSTTLWYPEKLLVKPFVR